MRSQASAARRPAIASAETARTMCSTSAPSSSGPLADDEAVGGRGIAVLPVFRCAQSALTLEYRTWPIDVCKLQFCNWGTNSTKTKTESLATHECVVTLGHWGGEGAMSSRLKLGSVAIVCLTIHGVASAADAPVLSAPGIPSTITQSLVLDGSMGLFYTDNAFATQTNHREAGYVVPFLRMTYGLKSADGWGFTLYRHSTSESYTYPTADNALATVGTTLSKTTNDTTIGVNFDTKFFYDGFFAARGITAYDLSAFITHPFMYKEHGLTIVPRFTVGYRWADLATAERASIDPQLTIEKGVIETWSLVAA